MRKIALILFLAGLITIGSYYLGATSRSLKSDEIIIYPVSCYDNNTPVESCKNKYVLGRIAYRIDKRKQEVIEYGLDSDSDKLLRLKKCNISTMDNWSCSYNDNSGSFGFKDEKFFEIISKEIFTPDSLTNRAYVSKAEYESLGK